MADYTIEELEQMLADKIQEELTDSVSPTDQLIDDVNTASDTETTAILSNDIIVGSIVKSKSLDKQFTEQRHYVNEMENGSIVGRSVSYCSYITGSYSATLTTPTLQVIRSRTVDRTVTKGS